MPEEYTDVIKFYKNGRLRVFRRSNCETGSLDAVGLFELLSRSACIQVKLYSNKIDFSANSEEN